MLKSCSYCFGIHPNGYECPRKPKIKKDPTHVNKFRWSRQWANKRTQINERDKYMCQICIRLLYNTNQRFNYTDIQVHHIIPLNEGIDGWDNRLNNERLICLCNYHHKMAENGKISRKELIEYAEEQEGLNCV